MRIFVTGATGYIGSRLCGRLVAAGHEVRALVRPTSRVEALAELGVATFQGDLGDRVSMREGMSGADWVIHAAAELDPDAPANRMQAANVQGSENVASLAYKLGIGRFLSVSSVASFGGSAEDGTPADESAAPRQPFPTRYSATKHAGQQVIQGYAQRGQLKVNTVYPGLVYGPPGRRGGANPLLARVLKGGYVVMAGGARLLSWIYLDDVVEAIHRVMTQAPPGRDFLLAGEVASLRAAVARVCALGEVRPPRWELPLGVARLVLAAMQPFYRGAGGGVGAPSPMAPAAPPVRKRRRPPFSAEQLGSLTRHWAFDDGRARRELGWAPRGLDQGLPPAVAYLRAV